MEKFMINNLEVVILKYFIEHLLAYIVDSKYNS